MKIGILGAGLTGLYLGRRLKESGVDFTIFEKESRPGGLCRTMQTGEHRWDFAVHAIYSRSREAMDYFCSLPLDYASSQRKARIVHCRKNNSKYVIDYPFENGVRDLPLMEKIECVLGYTATRMRKKDFRNLREWIDNRLGFGIARHFMIPYNTKIWSCGLREISNELVTSKIEPATAFEFIKGVFGKKVVGREYQAKFIYPRNGIQVLTDYIAAGIKDNILPGAGVEKLSRQGSGWVISAGNGVEVEADAVISTIPLAELLKKIDTEGVEKQCPQLKWNDTYFVMVGLRKDCKFGLIHDYHWVFFKGDEIFYRVTLMHNFDDNFLPALVAEVTEKDENKEMFPEGIKEAVVRDLLRLGIVGSRDDIAETDIKRVEYTYPIPTLELREARERISGMLEARNLFLLGRSGRWEYINMDGIILKVDEFISRKLDRFK